MFSIGANVDIGFGYVSHNAIGGYVTTKTIAIVFSHIAWLFLLPSCDATIIVAISDSTRAYIGADSLGSDGNEVCKIVAGRGIAVGISGHLLDTATGFNAATIIGSALAQSHDTSSAIGGILTNIEPPLAQTMAWGHRYTFPEYRESYEGKLALAILLISVDRGVPQIVSISWSTRGGTITRGKISTQGPNSFDAIGAYDGILKFIRAHPGWVDHPTIERIHALLNIEIDSRPSIVGRPISVVVVSRSGVKWVEGGACKAGKK